MINPHVCPTCNRKLPTNPAKIVKADILKDTKDKLEAAGFGCQFLKEDTLLISAPKLTNPILEWEKDGPIFLHQSLNVNRDLVPQLLQIMKESYMDKILESNLEINRERERITTCQEMINKIEEAPDPIVSERLSAS